MVVSDWCIKNLAHGWWVSIQSIVGIVRGKNWSLSGPLRWRSVFTLSDCRHPRFRNLNSTVPVDVVRVKSYLDNLLNSTRVPVRSSQLQLQLQLQLQSSVNYVCSFVQRCFWYTVHEKISCNSERVFNKTKDRQQRKFHKLLQKKQSSVLPTNTSSIDKNKWVVNLSSRPLSDTEVSLLQKGLNFAISPTSIPATEIVVKVESGINHFTQHEPTQSGELLIFFSKRHSHLSLT